MATMRWKQRIAASLVFVGGVYFSGAAGFRVRGTLLAIFAYNRISAACGGSAARHMGDDG